MHPCQQQASLACEELDLAFCAASLLPQGQARTCVWLSSYRGTVRMLLLLLLLLLRWYLLYELIAQHPTCESRLAVPAALWSSSGAGLLAEPLLSVARLKGCGSVLLFFSTLGKACLATPLRMLSLQVQGSTSPW